MQRLAVALMLLMTSAGMALAQETTGTISGRVVDAQGLAVPGATVTISGPQGTHTTTTSIGLCSACQLIVLQVVGSSIPQR